MSVFANCSKRTKVLMGVGIAGVALVVLIPGPNSPKAVVTAATASEAGAQSTQLDARIAVKDGFSGVLLAKTAPSVEADGSDPRNMRADEQGSSPMKPLIGDTFIGPLPMPIPGTTPEANESPGATRDKKQGQPRATVLLRGIVEVDERIALIAIDGKESRRYRIGDQIGARARLVEIEGTTAIVSVDGHRKALNLGKVTEL